MSWRHKLKKHILAIIPPYYGIRTNVDRATAQQNVDKALNNGNFTFHSYDVTVSFFPPLFHHLMEPLAASLWCTGAPCNRSHPQLHFQAERIASSTQDS